MWFAAADQPTAAIRACCTSHNHSKMNKTVHPPSVLQCKWHTHTNVITPRVDLLWSEISNYAMFLWWFSLVLRLFVWFLCSFLVLGLHREKCCLTCDGDSIVRKGLIAAKVFYRGSDLQWASSLLWVFWNCHYSITSIVRKMPEAHGYCKY